MMPNLQETMRQLQKMKAEVDRVNRELQQQTVTAAAGGGKVQVEFSGKAELRRIEIEPQLFTGDPQKLQQLIVAAVNEGIKKAKHLEESSLAKVTSGLKIPGMPPGLM
jgi:DNA-binding YbaB/EbfC family protein